MSHEEVKYAQSGHLIGTIGLDSCIGVAAVGTKGILKGTILAHISGK